MNNGKFDNVKNKVYELWSKNISPTHFKNDIQDYLKYNDDWINNNIEVTDKSIKILLTDKNNDNYEMNMKIKRKIKQ